MSDWPLWKAAFDALDRGDVLPLAGLLRDPTITKPHAALSKLADRLDQRAWTRGEIVDVVLVPKRTNAAHEARESRYQQVKRAALIRYQIQVEKKSVSAAIDCVTEKLNLTMDRGWQIWRQFRRENPDYEPDAVAARAEALRSVMEELTGLTTRAASAELNRRCIPAPNGGRWTAMKVSRTRKRLHL